MATYYVNQLGAGAQNGTSLGNAWSVANLNAPSSYTAGDTIILNGTISTQVTIQRSGTAGNPITLLFATGAKVSAAKWDSTGAILVYGNQSYVTIDGGATGTIGGPNGNASFVNGYIECTANGTGLANSVECVGILANEAKHFVVQNLAMYNLYVRTGTTDQIPSVPYGVAGIACFDNNGNGQNDLTFSNLLIHDTEIGIFTDYGVGGSNYTANQVTVYNCNWGGGTADRGAGATLSGLVVHDCWFYNFTNWNDTVGNQYHHNGWYSYAESGGTLTNPTYYKNKLGPGFGGSYQTSGIFVSNAAAGSTVNGATYYDNLFVAGAGEYCSNGMITFGSKAGTSRIYNNTFIGGVQQAVRGGGTTDIQNNVFKTETGTAIAFDTSATLTSSHNSFFNSSAVSPFVAVVSGSDVSKTLLQWQGLGYDLSPVTADPNLDANYVPQAGSPVIGVGSDQSAYFTTDYAGTAWAGGTGWGIGALKASGSGSTGGSSLSGKITLSGKVIIK